MTFLLRAAATLAVAALSLVASAENQSRERKGASPDGVTVLFIGNSFTFVNDLPRMLTELSRSSAGLRIRAETVTYPGASLRVHWNQGRALQAIRRQKWDFVVLQEQSTAPIDDRAGMYEYARQFDAEIRKTGATTIFFVTWAYRDRPQMQAELNRAYIDLSNELHARIAPVGPAWQIALERAPALVLHAQDGSHPTATGTYLAACVFYQVILNTHQPCPALRRGRMSPRDVDDVRATAAAATAAYH